MFLSFETVFFFLLLLEFLRYGDRQENKRQERNKHEKEVGKDRKERIKRDLQSRRPKTDKLLIQEIKIDGGYHIHTGARTALNKKYGKDRKNGHQKAQKEI